MFGLDTGAFDPGSLLGDTAFSDMAPGGLGGSYALSNTDSPFASGTFQALSSTLLGYLGKRLDVDINQRLYGHMPYPQKWGVNAGVSFTQQGVYPGAVRPPAQAATISLNGLMPWLLIAGAVYFVARKR